MFSEVLNREISKLVLVIFIYTSLSPAFCMVQHPEYVVKIERKQISSAEEEIQKDAFEISVEQPVNQQGVTSTVMQALPIVYETVFKKIVAPFMASTLSFMAQKIEAEKLYEVLQKVKMEVCSENSGNEFKTDVQNEIETEISRGFCLTAIPELGDLLISHDGDVVFNTEKTLGKSFKIIAPKQVILNNTTASDIEVEASSVILTGDTKSRINSLKFKGADDLSDLTNGLFIDSEASLYVEELTKRRLAVKYRKPICCEIFKFKWRMFI